MAPEKRSTDEHVHSVGDILERSQGLRQVLQRELQQNFVGQEFRIQLARGRSKGNPLMVRPSPGDYSSDVGRVYHDDLVRATGRMWVTKDNSGREHDGPYGQWRDHVWFEVDFGGGRLGWVSADYLRNERFENELRRMDMEMRQRFVQVRPTSNRNKRQEMRGRFDRHDRRGRKSRRERRERKQQQAREWRMRIEAGIAEKKQTQDPQTPKPANVLQKPEQNESVDEIAQEITDHEQLVREMNQHIRQLEAEIAQIQKDLGEIGSEMETPVPPLVEIDEPEFVPEKPAKIPVQEQEVPEVIPPENEAVEEIENEIKDSDPPLVEIDEPVVVPDDPVEIKTQEEEVPDVVPPEPQGSEEIEEEIPVPVPPPVIENDESESEPPVEETIEVSEEVPEKPVPVEAEGKEEVIESLHDDMSIVPSLPDFFGEEQVEPIQTPTIESIDENDEAVTVYTGKEYFKHLQKRMLEAKSSTLDKLDQEFVDKIPRGKTNIFKKRILSELTGLIHAETELPDDVVNELERVFGKVVKLDWENERNMGKIQKTINQQLNDPHFLLLDAENEMIMDLMQGMSPDFGIIFDSSSNIIKDFSSTDDNPAIEAGIKIGDKIISVDGATDMPTIYENMSHGPAEAEFVVERNGELLKFVIDPIDVSKDLIEMKMMTNETLYVKFDDFHTRIAERLVPILDETDHKRLVLDLRGNGGGALEEFVELADYFLRSGTIGNINVLGRERSKIQAENLSSDYPAENEVIILVNGNSASASELLADALQRNKRAVVVGSETYGKDFGQIGYEISDRFAFYMSMLYQPDRGPGSKLQPDISDRRLSSGKFDDDALERLDDLLIQNKKKTPDNEPAVTQTPIPPPVQPKKTPEYRETLGKSVFEVSAGGKGYEFYSLNGYAPPIRPGQKALKLDRKTSAYLDWFDKKATNNYEETNFPHLTDWIVKYCQTGPVVDEDVQSMRDKIRSLGITDIRKLTPRQGILLSSAIVQNRMEYSNLQASFAKARLLARLTNGRFGRIELDPEYVAQLNEEEKALLEESRANAMYVDQMHNSASVNDLMQTIGEGTCVNYPQAVKAVFECLKGIQDPKTNQLANTYCKESVSTPQRSLEVVQDTVGHHGWNSFHTVVSPNEVHSVVIDTTFADTDDIEQDRSYSEDRFVFELQDMESRNLLPKESQGVNGSRIDVLQKWADAQEQKGVQSESYYLACNVLLDYYRGRSIPGVKKYRAKMAEYYRWRESQLEEVLRNPLKYHPEYYVFCTVDIQRVRDLAQAYERTGIDRLRNT